MSKIREALGEYASLVYFLIILIIIGIIFYFSIVNNNKSQSAQKIQTSNVVYAPGQSNAIENEDKNLNPDQKNKERVWPKDFYIISESLIPVNESFQEQDAYFYGQKIFLDENKQIIENRGKTGRYVASEEGLVSPYFYSIYKKIFPLNVDAYKKIPIDAKYKILVRADAFCGNSSFNDSSELRQILFSDSVPESVRNYGAFDISSCAPSFTMSKAEYVAQRSVAYADMDENKITPKSIFVVMQPAKIYGQNACNGWGNILHANANLQYSLLPTNIANICYVESVAKGAMVPITKLGVQNIYGEQTQNKTLYKMPSAGFALHLSDTTIKYLVYDQSSPLKFREINSRQNIYNYQYKTQGGY